MTVTASHCERSAGGKHDFFSEGDYWWPDPANPDGPYIQRDGLSNTNNFMEHRHAMIRSRHGRHDRPFDETARAFPDGGCDLAFGRR